MSAWNNLETLQGWSSKAQWFLGFFGIVTAILTVTVLWIGDRVSALQDAKNDALSATVKNTSTELKLTRDELSEQARRNAALEEQLRPKPFDVRLREFLNNIPEFGAKILEGLAKSPEREQLFRAELSFVEESEIRRLCAEGGSDKFIILVPPEASDSAVDLKDTGVKVTQVRFRLKKALLPKE